MYHQTNRIRERTTTFGWWEYTIVLAVVILCLEFFTSQFDGDEDLVFVSSTGGGAGCTAVSVLSASTGQIIHFGQIQGSSLPARLAALPDFSRVFGLSIRDSYYSQQHLYTLRKQEHDNPKWDSSRSTLYITSSAVAGGLAVMSDGDTLLMATQGRRPLHTTDVHYPPYGISKFRLSEIERDSNGVERLGAVRGHLDTIGIPAEIFPTGVSEFHVITNKMEVLTIDANSMTEIAPRIELPRYWPSVNVDNSKDFLGSIHGSVSTDGRYLVATRWESIGTDLAVADLQERKAWAIPTNGISITYDVAFNHGSVNAGLLAVHGFYSVGVYRFTPPDQMMLIGQTALDRKELQVFPGAEYVLGAMDWVSDGRRLVVDEIVRLTQDRLNGPATQLRIIEVDNGGEKLVLKSNVATCGDSRASTRAADVLTSNTIYFPPAAVPSPMMIPTATVDATSTATKEPTSAPTQLPGPTPRLYVPRSENSK